MSKCLGEELNEKGGICLMNKKVLKSLSLILVCWMVLSVSIGCQQNNQAPAPSSTDNETESADKPKPAQPVKTFKYTFFINQSIAEYPPDGGEAKQVIIDALKEAGIEGFDYEVQMVGGGEYDTKLNVLIASGDEPDAFRARNIDLRRFSESGVITPLSKYIEQMPHYKEMANELDLTNMSVDGEVFAFPQAKMKHPLVGDGVHGLIIRRDWLENLNMETPTTLDQLYDVLYAFTYKDPNRSGKKDTYGIGGWDQNWFNFVFGAYGLFLNNGKTGHAWVERNGRIEHTTVQPEVKEILSTLQKWYKDGIIDPDKFVVKGKQAKEKFINGNIGAYEQTVWWANDARKAWKDKPEQKVEIIPPVKGPQGLAGYPAGAIVNQGVAIAQRVVDEKDIDTLIKVLDWSVNTGEDGGFELVTYGIEGEDYTYDAQNDRIVQTLPEGYSSLYKKGYSNPVRFIRVNDRRWMDVPEQIRDIKIPSDPNNLVYSACYQSVTTMADYPDIFDKLWAEYFVKIVTGEYSVDKHDEYVQKFNSQGGAEVTKQVNELMK